MSSEKGPLNPFHAGILDVSGGGRITVFGEDFPYFEGFREFGVGLLSLTGGDFRGVNKAELGP